MSDSDIKESKSAIVFDVFKRVALNYVIALEEQEGIKEGDGNSIGISVAHVYSVLNVIAIELKTQNVYPFNELEHHELEECGNAVMHEWVTALKEGRKI